MKASFGGRGSAWTTPTSENVRGWPGKALPFNLPLRLTVGLRRAYEEVRASRTGGTSRTVPETAANGRLVLSPTMPLIGQRYRYLHTLSESDLSQIVSAVDTYRHCSAAADGRRSPLVALKILNAQHWMLGAQEHERMRQLWRAFSRLGASPRVARPLAYLEEGAHFIIALELYEPIEVLHSPLLATPGLDHRPPAVAASAAGLGHHIVFGGGGFGGGGGGTGASVSLAPVGYAGEGGGAASLDASLPPSVSPSDLTSTHRLMPSGSSWREAAASCPPQPRLDISTLRHVCADLLGALAALHSQGVRPPEPTRTRRARPRHRPSPSLPPLPRRPVDPSPSHDRPRPHRRNTAVACRPDAGQHLTLTLILTLTRCCTRT